MIKTLLLAAAFAGNAQLAADLPAGATATQTSVAADVSASDLHLAQNAFSEFHKTGQDLKCFRVRIGKQGNLLQVAFTPRPAPSGKAPCGHGISYLVGDDGGIAGTFRPN